MRSFVRSIAITGGILLCAGVPYASAQISEPVEFTTSFAFTVGEATVPAGTYTITPDDLAPEMLTLTGAHGSVLFQTNPASTSSRASKSEVVFKRYGGAYVLKSIWIAGSDRGAEALSAHGEQHVAKGQDLTGELRLAARRPSVSARNR
jgi:hypothetical protein